MAKKRDWIFYGGLYRVIDGDTFQAEIDLGFDTINRPIFRISGIDTPETEGATKQMGQIAKTYLERTLIRDTLTIASIKKDKYGGRYDAIVRIGDSDVGDRMILDGYAKAYSGKGPRPVWDHTKPYPLPEAERGLH